MVLLPMTDEALHPVWCCRVAKISFGMVHCVWASTWPSLENKPPKAVPHTDCTRNEFPNIWEAPC